MGRRAALLAITVASVAILCAGYSLRSDSPASVNYEATIDLGERELGEVVTQQLRIANTGGSPLCISDVRTTCSCSGLERVVGESVERVADLVVLPGQSENLRARLAVRGPVGNPLRTALTFRTNDPCHTAGQIDLVVRRILGIACDPPAVVFGAACVGDELAARVGVRDLCGEPVTIVGVECSDPENLSARVLAGCDAVGDSLTPASSAIEVRVRSGAAKMIMAELRISVSRDKGPKVISVPVSAHIAAPVEVLPREIYLPRSSAAGPVYHAVCMFHSSLGREFTLRSDDVPAGLKVTLADGHRAKRTQLVRVEWEKISESRPAARNVIRLVAEAGGTQYPVEVTVNWREPESP